MVLRFYLIIILLSVTEFFWASSSLLKSFYSLTLSISSLLIFLLSSSHIFSVLTEQFHLVVWQAISTNSVILQSPDSTSSSFTHTLVNNTVNELFYKAKDLGVVLYTYLFLPHSVSHQQLSILILKHLIC